MVRRAQDTTTGQHVAVKTFNRQARRDCSEEALTANFARGVEVLHELGVAPGAPPRQDGRDPRAFLVNLLDYSRSESGAPAPDGDGVHYSVFELADESLDEWLCRQAERPTAERRVSVDELRAITMAVAEGLRWLHSRGLCHLDVKAQNIMRFGDRWKLIDLEGCQPVGEGVVSEEMVTPKYVSPELARAILARAGLDDAGVGNPRLPPLGAMDAWGAGLVLLDVLTDGEAWEDWKNGYDAASLFEDEAIQDESWYRWLAAPEPFDLLYLLGSGAAGGSQRHQWECLQSVDGLQGLLASLLEKDPDRRTSASELCEHPLLASLPQSPSRASAGHQRGQAAAEQLGDGPRGEQLSCVAPEAATGKPSAEAGGMSCKDRVEDACRKLDAGVWERWKLKCLLEGVGLLATEAEALLQEFDPAGKARLSCSEFFDFVFSL